MSLTNCPTKIKRHCAHFHTEIAATPRRVATNSHTKHPRHTVYCYCFVTTTDGRPRHDRHSHIRPGNQSPYFLFSEWLLATGLPLLKQKLLYWQHPPHAVSQFSRNRNTRTASSLLCGAGFLITKGNQLMTALSMLLGPVYFYMDFFNRFGYFPGQSTAIKEGNSTMLVRYSVVQLAMYPIMWAFYSFWH